jgi:hypothetical protein
VNSTAFFDIANGRARAAMTGTALPEISGKLLAHFSLSAVFFSGAAALEVDAGTAQFAIFPKSAPPGAAALIDTVATLTGTGEDAVYEFAFEPADSVQLRAALDAQADPTALLEMRYEVKFEVDGEERAIGGPCYFENNFFRPETVAPDAPLNSSWETLKTRVLAGDNLTRTIDDDAQTMTFAGEDSEANAAAIAAEEAARIAADDVNAAAIAAEEAARIAADDVNTAAIALKAPIASPAFTGTPTAPTQVANDASTRIATTAHVESKVIKTNALGSYSLSQKSIHAANSGLQVMIPVRLADASESLSAGSYDLITVPANFRLESFRLVFDGPTFVSPDAPLGFTIQSLLGGETSVLHSHSDALNAQVIAPVLAGFSISPGALLRLDIDTFDGVGYYASGIAQGGVVWLGGFWL